MISVSDSNKRISWDEYFISVAKIISLRSPSMKLRVGSVLVRDKRIVSCGYNGYPSGLPHEPINVDGHEVNTIHSEVNAIADSAKRGVSIQDSVLYVTHFPCLNCSKSIIASGIKEIIYLNDYKNDLIATKLLQDANITTKKFSLSE